MSSRPLGERPSERQSCLDAWKGAGEQDERALAIGEAALGPDHPTVATYRNNLGGVL
ncbi:MAG TPA: tetratricopeptide repeat protein [Propionibacteriaceae bacterium]|nr:tetratricopeptide repeat protein [Propionibacteriaceae bacterium]